MSDNTQLHRNTIIVAFAMQPIMENDKESKESTKELGFVLLDAAKAIKYKKKSGALLAIVYIVSNILEINDLLKETKIRMSKHRIKWVREFAEKSPPNVIQLLQDNQNIFQENQQLYFDTIITFMERFGIKDVIKELNKQAHKNNGK